MGSPESKQPAAKRAGRGKATDMTVEELAGLRSMTPAQFNAFTHKVSATLLAMVASASGLKDLTQKANETLAQVILAKKESTTPKIEQLKAQYTASISQMKVEIKRVSELERGAEAPDGTLNAMNQLLDAHVDARTNLDLEIEGLMFYVRLQVHEKGCAKQRDYYKGTRIMGQMVAGKFPRAFCELLSSDIHWIVNTADGQTLPESVIRRCTGAVKNPEVPDVDTLSTFTDGAINTKIKAFIENAANNVVETSASCFDGLLANPSWPVSFLPLTGTTIASAIFNTETHDQAGVEGTEPGVYCVRGGAFCYGAGRAPNAGQAQTITVMSVAPAESMKVYVATLKVRTILARGPALQDLAGYLALDGGALLYIMDVFSVVRYTVLATWGSTFLRSRGQPLPKMLVPSLGAKPRLSKPR